MSYLRTVLVALVLGFSLVMPSAASAATTSELQAQINALLAQIAVLQNQITQQTGGSSSTGTIRVTSFTASPDRIRSGESTLLSWSVQNAESCDLRIEYSSKKGYGSRLVKSFFGSNSYSSYSVSPSSSTTYQLYCSRQISGGFASDSRSVTVTVNTNGSNNSGSSNNPRTATYYGYLNGSQFIETRDSTESEALSNCKLNARNNPYSSIRCTWNGREIYSAGSNGTSTGNRNTPTLSFYASADRVSAGEGVTLSWYTTDAQRCWLQYGSNEQTISVNGSLNVNPYQTTTYKIGCANDSGTGKDGPTVDRSVTVTVKNSGSTGGSGTATPPSNSSQGAAVVGVYEGTRSGSDREGKVYVNVSGNVGQNRDLILTAYEPVQWIVNVPNGVIIPRVILMGYHNQRVTGLPSSVYVEKHSYESDGQYQYSYQASGDSYRNLANWLNGLYPNNWIFQPAGYSASSVNVNVGYKG
ncbi:MAG: hypothetical protein AB199_01070 [Parcubacteria bacterium C7867-004]|nr:MAG: hypothetical protein AB199_01070 [Parcubacteria bacterium C7867-004]